MPPIACALGTHLIASLIVAISPPAGELEVRLKDNHVRVGYPDLSTNATRLRLRVGDSDAYVIFGIDWDQIASVRYKSEVWTLEMFPALRQEMSNTLQAERLAPQLSHELTNHDHLSSTRPLWQTPVRPAPSESPSSHVQLIEIDAVAANWNADPEWDGLVVRIWPMDRSGQVIEVPGTVTASLTGDSGYSMNSATQRLAHWVRAVGPSDYGADGFNLRLPFQNYEPERWEASGHRDHRIGTFGELHVSFAIPGHGVYRASTVTPVRLRRFSPERDRIFLRSGSRSLLSEP